MGGGIILAHKIKYSNNYFYLFYYYYKPYGRYYFCGFRRCEAAGLFSIFTCINP